MTYKDGTPTYNNGNRKVFHFDDFVNNINDEEKELKKVKRSFTKNDDNVYNLPNKTKYKWNKVTKKMDDLSQDMIDDKIDAVEDLKESVSLLKIKEMIDIALIYDNKSKIDFDDAGLKIMGNFHGMEEDHIDMIEKKGGEVTDNSIMVQTFSRKS